MEGFAWEAGELVSSQVEDPEAFGSVEGHFGQLLELVALQLELQEVCQTSESSG